MLTCIPILGQAGLEDTVCEHFGSALFFTLYDRESDAPTIVTDVVAQLKVGMLRELDPSEACGGHSHGPGGCGAQPRNRTRAERGRRCRRAGRDLYPRTRDAQPTELPGGIVPSTVRRRTSPPAWAARSMPCDSTPRIFAGSRFATTTISLPTSSSGV